MKIVVVLILSIIPQFVLAQTDRIITDSTSRSSSTTTSITETTINSPPPTAISPGITVINNDLCVVGVAGAVQTQILGISGGSTVRDLNCERLKLAKNLYDMGMKVAAVSTLCQDHRVFTAMQNAGTPCPVDGKIGTEAQQIWDANPARKPQTTEVSDDVGFWQKVSGGLGILLILLLLL